MGVDVDAYLAARTPWTVTLDRIQYTARWVSAEQAAAFLLAWEQIRGEARAHLRAGRGDPDGGGGEGEAPTPAALQAAVRHLAELAKRERALLRGFLRALFPWRLHYRWRGDPVEKILALDREARDVVLRDFFLWRARETARLAAMSGTSSPNGTSPAPPDPASPPDPSPPA